MVRFRRLMAVTTVLTFVLMLLGIYTAAFGAGLTCGARWPFCDGWMGLFPANIPSFVEWFHRLVAMITGFVILGTTYVAWRSHDDRRVAWSLTLAVFLLPVQIGLGAVTVTLNGLVPGGYSPLVQAFHYVTALSILALLTVGLALTLGTDWLTRRRLTGFVSSLVVLLPVQYLFSFDSLLLHTPLVQIVYNALSLTLFGLLVLLAVWSPVTRWLRWLATLGSVLLAMQMLLGRRLWGTIDPFISDGLSLGLAVVFLLVIWLLTRSERGVQPDSTNS